MVKPNPAKQEAAIALRKAQTHIAKILNMLETNAYCIDVLQQILAVNGLLKSASTKILKNHLETCFSAGLNNKDQAKKTKLINEVIDVINLANKSK